MRLHLLSTLALRRLALGVVAGLMGACVAPSFDAQMQEALRAARQQQRDGDELERLQRLGRFDEAERLARKIDREAAADADSRGPDAGMSMAEAVQLQRRVADTDERFLVDAGEPLCVRPVWLAVFPLEKQLTMPVVLAELQETLGQSMALAASGDLAGARALAAQAEADARERYGPDAVQRLPVLQHRAGLEEFARDPAAALARNREAAALAERSGRPDWLASFAAREGELLLETNDLDGALAAARRVQSITANSDASSRAAALNNLGVVLAHRRDAAGALDAYQAASATLGPPAARLGLMDLHARKAAPMRPVVLSNMGLARRQQGEPAAALAFCREAIDARAAWDDVDAPEGLPEGAALARAAVLAEELNPVVALEQSVAATPATSPTGLRLLFERKGAVLERQTRAMEAIRESAAVPTSRTVTAAEGRAAPPATADSMLHALRQPAFTRAGALAEALRSGEAVQAERTRAENRDLIEAYEAALAERASLEGAPPANAADREAHERRRVDLDRRIRVMQAEIGQRGEQARNPMPQPFDAAAIARGDVPNLLRQLETRLDVQRERREGERTDLPARVRARIPEGAVLLEMLVVSPVDAAAPTPPAFVFGKPRYATYLVRREGAPLYIDFGEVEAIDRQIVSLRKALAFPRSIATAREAGRELDALLMAPVRRAAPGATVLLLAPEGNLNLVPFGALVDESGRFLVERYSFNYLASGRDLLRDVSRGRPRSPGLIVADPLFEGADTAAPSAAEHTARRSIDFRGLRYEPLPGTAEEAAAIKRLMPDAVLLSAGGATESAVKRTRGPQVLHLATHGFFLEHTARGTRGAMPRAQAENPMLRSGLVFAGVNTLVSGEDDGVLTALEAAGLDLVGTRLVVLSACETGLGDVRNGEGVFGLRRAFVVAGAESLVMSLWQVEDTATQTMMTEYYRRLAGGEDRVDSLRQAQLALLGDPMFRHPFFWAGFIASGQSGGLR